MKNTLFEYIPDRQLPRQAQIARVRRAIETMLTPLQREVLTAYYFHDLSITQIARNRGVNKSSVCRTLHRAENILRRCLQL